MTKKSIISKRILIEALHSNGLWLNPKLHEHICQTFESDLNKTIKILKKDMAIKKRKKVKCQDYDEANSKFRESFMAEFVNGIMDRIKHGLDSYKDEVNKYYGSFEDMQGSPSEKE